MQHGQERIAVGAFVIAQEVMAEFSQHCGGSVARFPLVAGGVRQNYQPGSLGADSSRDVTFRHSIFSPTALACKLALSATICRTAVAQVSASAPQRNVYFGDLHLHSSFSADAFVLGTRTTPDYAFNFAKGQPVSFFGRTVKRRTPLDFLALTDHDEIAVGLRILCVQ
ncbi:DUF3604 domain-containing protein [Tardiphaga sp. vice304]|nr:DUF3604 domain-containing protein [Tardiphaga sp. vice154]QDM28432.1 DUF3604 domain-containing protein [Tardiphaga sp. vice304]